MVLPGAPGADRGPGLMADGAPQPPRKRQRPLHNFDLPSLKWGNQLNLRPINYGADIFPLGSGNPHSLIAADYASPDTSRPLDKSSHLLSLGFPFERSQHLPPLVIRDDEEHESIRKKLRVHLRSLTVASFSHKKGEGLEFVGITPWNLRTRRAACDSPAKIAQDEGGRADPDDSPSPKPETRPKSLRLRGLAPDEFAKAKDKKKEAVKFSVSLSKNEIEDDLLAMTGSKPSRRPKKRTKIVQKKLDEIFPGLWLSNVTPDLYKVTDSSEPKI